MFASSIVEFFKKCQFWKKNLEIHPMFNSVVVVQGRVVVILEIGLWRSRIHGGLSYNLYIDYMTSQAYLYLHQVCGIQKICRFNPR